MKKTTKKKYSLRQKFQKLNKEIKIFFAIIFLLFAGTITIYFTLNSAALMRADLSAAQVAVGKCQSDKPELICWNGKPWFLVGANLAWLDWSCDFGTGCSWASTLSNPAKQTRLRQELTTMKAANINTVRWWVFQDAPGGVNGAGNTRIEVETRQGKKYPSDTSNSSLLYPTRIKDEVFRDIQTALDIAEETDMYYNFTLFGAHGDWYASNFPQEWIYNPEYQDQLARVMGTLYERFKNHPRIIAWEIWNEPDQGLDIYVEQPVGSGNYILDPRHATRRASLLELTRKLVVVQREKSPASLVNFGVQVSNFNYWKVLNPDFYSPHYYTKYNSKDYNQYAGDDDLFNISATALRQKYGITQPILPGELYMGSGLAEGENGRSYEPRPAVPAPLGRYTYLFDSKYAGAWGWSWNYRSTSDLLQIDTTASTSFGSNSLYAGYVGPRKTPGQVLASPSVNSTSAAPSSNTASVLPSPVPSSPVPQSTTCKGSPNRICWRGEESFLLGVNMAWYNWAQDFSGGTSGVANTKNQLESRFSTLQQNKIKNVRWWMFQGDNIGQITRDSSGLPSGFNQNIYRDIDAALELARKYDLYYHFTLFSTALGLPSNWIDNATGRQRLAAALAPLFARYKDEPRIVSWESFNEPEIATVNQGWGTDSQGNYLVVNNPTGQQNIALAANEIAKVVHSATRRSDGSTTLSSVGQYYAAAMSLYNNTEIDFHQPHFYDNYGHTRNRDLCLVCRDFNGWKSFLGINKPLVVGEWFGNTYNGVSAYQRLNEFRDKGFAGAWAWSLWWDKTNDQFQVNFADFKRFAEENACIVGPGISGPNCPGSAPTPSTRPSASIAPSNTPISSPSPLPTISPIPSPTSTTNLTVPGRIEAESFNNTGNNVGYYDTTAANEGGVYLTNTSVDIQHTTDTTGGTYNVGWTRSTEWLTYTFTAREAGAYKIQSRVANMMPGGVFELIIDGASIGNQSVPGTSGWQNFQNVESDQFNLTAGSHTLRVNMKTNAWSNAVGNFNYFEFVKVNTAPQPSASLIPTNPGNGSLWKAININGPTLNVDGVLFQAGDQVGATYRNYAKINNQNIPLAGGVSASKAEMIRSSIWGSGGCCYEFPRISLPNVPSGTYDIYAYIWEDNYNEKLQLLVEGKVVQSNINSGKAGDWQKLGPHRVNVTDNTLEVGFYGGNANFSGLEIWKVQ